MQFNKVLIALQAQAFLLIFIMLCLVEPAVMASSRTLQKGRTASLRKFPEHQRQVEGHGRSALVIDSEYDKQPVLMDKAEEGRGLMKKFMLFKSLFTQQKSEPNSNVIIITQPAADGGPQTPTTTMPTATGTTTTTASNADTPTVGGNTGRGTQAQDEQNDEDVLGVFEESKPEDIVQQLIKQTKPNQKRFKKLKRQLTKTQKQQQQQWQQWQRQQQQQHLQHNKRKRLANRVPQTKPQRQRQRQQENQLLLLNNINLSQQPNQKSGNNKNYNKHNGSNNNNNSNSNTNNNNNNMASGILNLNTNMRLQNIMNAFRKQTPIVYNY